MWDVRRDLDPLPLPLTRTVVQFPYSDLPATKSDWQLRIEADGEVYLFWWDQGSEINLYVTTDLRTMSAMWMGIGTDKS